ncbi:Piwi-like protein 1 [Exaiptasia diaphana]|nr:Piwi-like protein 1 [Exaiptasia diaphana]
MTGRARGRSRGRGRTEAQAGGDAARRPGEPAVRPPEPAQVGRGRSRGPPSDAAPARPQPTAAAEPPTAAMSGLSVAERGGARGPPEQKRGGRFSEPVTRPPGLNKQGSSGREVSLVSNCFLLETRPNFMIYQYNVSFSPEVDSKKVKFGLVMSQESLIGRVRAFDGMTMFLPIKLQDPVTKINTTRRRRDNPDGEPVEITITLTNELPQDSPTVMQLFNIILRRILKMIDMNQVGRQYYYTRHAIAVNQYNLEIWPGYSTSILKHECGVLLGADVSHKVLRKETVLAFLYDLYKSNQRNFHEIAAKKLVGEIVLTRYNNKTYRIDDISWDERPHHTFSTGRGEISYVDYYAKHYEKQITDMEQPLLIHRPKKIPGKKYIEQIKLLPELCFITGLSDDMRNDFNLMKDLAKHTRIAPKERCEQLMKFIGEINGHAEASSEMTGWGLQFARNLLSFKGRMLPAEAIYQKSKKSSYDPKTADWSRETRGSALHSTVNITNWLVILTNRDRGAIGNDFVSTMKRVLEPMGISTGAPRVVAIDNDRTESYLNAIRSEVGRDMPQIVVAIVPTNRKDRYDAIKKVCCLEMPVPSQVIVSRTLSKKQMLMSVCTKIGIQLNCKLGGEAWALEIPESHQKLCGVMA